MRLKFIKDIIKIKNLKHTECQVIKLKSRILWTKIYFKSKKYKI